jgi:membrane-associated phospholipid phosphatase
VSAVRRRLLLLVLAYAAIAAAVVGVGWLITHPFDGPVDSFDDPVSRWFAGERESWLDPVAEVGTLLGETPVGLGVAAVVSLVAGLALRALWPVLMMALADVGHGGIYWLGTHADPRDRPPVKILDSGLVPDHSFPSGHVGTAVAVYGGAAVLLAVWLRSRDSRNGLARALVVLLAVVPLFVAASRLYEGAHHLTDVATSLAYAGAWLAAAAALTRPRATAPEPAVSRSTRGDEHAPVPHR